MNENTNSLLPGRALSFGFISGVLFLLAELFVCLELPSLLAPGNAIVVYKDAFFLGMLAFDLLVALAMTFAVYALCLLCRTSPATYTYLMSTVVLVGFPWLYGCGVILQEFPNFTDNDISNRQVLIGLWSLISLIAVAVVFFVQCRFFVKGMSLALHSVLFCVTSFLLLLAVRNIKVAPELHRTFFTIGFSDVLPIFLTAAVAGAMTSARSSVRLKRCLAGIVVLAGAALAVRIHSVVNRNPLAAYAVSGSQSDSHDSSRPNVILIVLDTFRSDRLGCYGYPKNITPNLDKFADEADLYRRCYSTSSWTLPAHASLFTGQFPRTHGAHHVPKRTGRPLPDEAKTLAEVLQDNGYRTGAVIANISYLNTHFGLAQGFSFYQSDYILDRNAPILFGTAAFFLASIMPDSNIVGCMRDLARPVRLPYPGAEVVLDVSLAWIDSAPDRPFFLFINLMDSHAPYIPPTRFARNADGTLPESIDMSDLQSAYLPSQQHMPQELRDRLVSLYDGTVAFLDHELGFFFQELDKRDIYDNTILIVTSDHGEYLGEHGLLEHDLSLHEEVVSVPLMIKYAGRKGGIRQEHIVQLVDVMPTLCGELDIPVPEQVQGGPLDSPGHLPVAWLYEYSFNVWAYGERFRRTVTAFWQGDYKVIRNSTGKQEVFNLRKDPREMVDIAENTNATVRSIEQAAEKFQKNKPVFVVPSDEPKVGPDEETIERLMRLGYLE